MRNQIIKNFIKAISENPDLPIKVFICGDCYDGVDFDWYLGNVYDCKVTEIAEYNNRTYEKDDIDEIASEIYDDIGGYEEYKKLSDDEVLQIANRKAEELEWEKVILLLVGV